MTAISADFCDPSFEECDEPDPFIYDRGDYVAHFAVVAIVSMANAFIPMIIWFASYKSGRDLADFVPNDYLYYAW